MDVKLEQGHLPNTCQYTAQTKRGDYLVQIAWPLSWSTDRIPPENDGPASTLYLVDGNAYFFTAVDVSRRLECLNTTRCVVVGIGYPPSQYVYDWRRGPDLTPASPDGKYEVPIGSDGKPRTDLKFGEAHHLLDLIQNEVMPHVNDTLFPKASLKTGRKALYGHSYGGIFALNTLFTQPTLFNTYLVASPTIWWNNYYLVNTLEAAFKAREEPVDPAPSVAITWGSGEQDIVQGPDESDAQFEKRKLCSEDKRQRESAKEMVARLQDCPSIRKTWSWEFVGEDHGSAAVTGLQQGISKFLVDKL